jgi:hypothetical protein
MHDKDRSFRGRKSGDSKNTGKMIDMSMSQYHENGTIPLLPAFPDNGRKLFCLFGKAPRINEEDNVGSCKQVRVGGEGIDLPY